MSMYRNLTTAAAVAALAFGLAACGGGGGDGGPTTSVDDLDWTMLAGASIPAGTYEIAGAPEDLLEQAAALDVPEGGYAPGASENLAGYTLTCASNSPTNCNVAVNEDGTITTTGTITVTTYVAMPDPEPMPVAVTVPDAMYLDEDNMPAAGTLTIAAGMTGTSGGVTFLCAEGGDACEVTVADDGSVTATGGMVTASLTTDAMDQVADAKQMKADDDADMAQMARERAIGQAAAMASPGTPPGITSISHPAGKDVSVRVTGFTPTEAQPGMLGNFTGVSLSNTSSATATQYMTVYTDIAEPGRREFFNFDGDGDTPAAYTETATDSGIINLVLPADNDQTSEGSFSAGNIDLNIFPTRGPASGGTVTKTFEANARTDGTAATDPPNLVRLPGTFDGARGSYMCAAAECVVAVAPSGAYTLTTGTWTFAPNEGERAYHEDSEFLQFGWWMSEPTRSTGTYQFATFVDGSDYRATVAATETTGAGVTGDATYTGNAAGRYSVGDDAGAFTASASLTAKFGNGTAVGTISGMISGFQGDADMSGWSVELKRITLTDFAANDATSDAPAFTSGNLDQSSSTYDGTIATLGDTMAHGSWSGRFYGNARNADRPGTLSENAQPLAVGGQFDAAGTEASISGAFGARRPK